MATKKSKTKRGYHMQEVRVTGDLSKKPYTTHRRVKNKSSKPEKKTWWGAPITK